MTLRVIVFSPLALACPIFHGVTIGRYLDGKVVHSIDRSLEKSNNSIIDHLVLFYRTIFGARLHGIEHRSCFNTDFCHLDLKRNVSVENTILIIYTVLRKNQMENHGTKIGPILGQRVCFKDSKCIFFFKILANRV